jgi:hypothetical protein
MLGVVGKPLSSGNILGDGLANEVEELGRKADEQALGRAYSWIGSGLRRPLGRGARTGLLGPIPRHVGGVGQKLRKGRLWKGKEDGLWLV